MLGKTVKRTVFVLTGLLCCAMHRLRILSIPPAVLRPGAEGQ